MTAATPDVVPTLPQPRIASPFARVALLAALVAQAVLSARSLARLDDQAGSPLTAAGHLDVAYRAWCDNVGTERGSAPVELAFNAGAGSSTVHAGDVWWARWWVGSEAAGPDHRGYLLAVTCTPVAGLVLLVVAAGLASRSIGMVAGAAWLVVCLWWLKPQVALWESGRCASTLFGPVAGLYLAALSRFHHRASLFGWTALVASSWLGWSLFPGAWLAFAFPATACWLAISFQHSLLWHGWLLLALAVGAAPALAPWTEQWRNPSAAMMGLPGELAGWPLQLAGAARRRGPAVAVHVLLLAVPWLVNVAPLLRRTVIVTLLTSVLLTLLASGSLNQCREHIGRIWGPGWLPCGWSPAESEALDVVSRQVKPSARLLCETSAADPRAQALARWLAYSNRAAVLVDDGGEASPWSFADGELRGRPLADWNADELARFYARWNVGWVWTRSPAATWPGGQTKVVKTLHPLGDAGHLLVLDRPHRFVLKGCARWRVDEGVVSLSDVIPEDGEVLLSLCWRSNWSISPFRLAIEPEIDPYDAACIVRLRLDAPVSRVELRPGS